MAKIPGAVTAGTAPQPRPSALEQILIGLVSQAPGLAMQYFGQVRPEQQERARQMEIAKAQDIAGVGELQSMLGLSRQPGVEGDVLSNFLTGAGLAPLMPQGLNDRTGLAAVPKGLDQTKLQTLQTIPGAIFAMAERGRGVQESGLRIAATRENIAASQAQRRLATEQNLREAELQPYKVSTLEFERTLQPGIKDLQDLDILYKEAQRDAKLLEANTYSQQMGDRTIAMRERAYGFVVGLRDRNLQMVSSLAQQFGGTGEGAVQMFAKLAPLFGLDVDVNAVTDSYFNAITTGQDPEQIRTFLDINPVRLMGSVLEVSPLDVDNVISHVEAGGDLGDYWTDTLALINTAFKKDSAGRDKRIVQLKAFFEAANSYYKLGETFNVPGNPKWWSALFSGLIDRARETRGITTTAVPPPSSGGIVSIDPALQGTWAGSALSGLGTAASVAGRGIGAAAGVVAGAVPTMAGTGEVVVGPVLDWAKRDLSRGPSVRGSVR